MTLRELSEVIGVWVGAVLGAAMIGLAVRVIGGAL